MTTEPTPRPTAPSAMHRGCGTPAHPAGEAPMVPPERQTVPGYQLDEPQRRALLLLRRALDARIVPD